MASNDIPKCYSTTEEFIANILTDEEGDLIDEMMDRKSRSTLHPRLGEQGDPTEILKMEITKFNLQEQRKKELREFEKIHKEEKQKYQKYERTPLPWEKPKKPTKFTDYYYGSDEFRKKHNKYMTTKVPCPKCGFITSRANMSKHQVSRNCKKRSSANSNILEKKKEMLELADKLFSTIKNI